MPFLFTDRERGEKRRPRALLFEGAGKKKKKRGGPHRLRPIYPGDEKVERRGRGFEDAETIQQARRRKKGEKDKGKASLPPAPGKNLGERGKEGRGEGRFSEKESIEKERERRIAGRLIEVPLK